MKLIGVIGVFLVVLSSWIAVAQQKPPADQLPGATIRSLLREVLPKEFANGREVLIDIVEVPPNTHVAPHWHPGEEYQYVLEGEATVKIEGQPDFEIREGMAGRIPYKAVHSVMTKDKGIKVVVFRIHTSGKPVRFAKGEKGSS